MCIVSVNSARSAGRMLYCDHDNTITGEGLQEAVAGAQVAIDLANSPSFEDKAVLEFFQTSGRNMPCGNFS
jgi:hypothetical protein